MMVPVSLFTVLIYVALAMVVAAPLILLALWFRDRHKGELW